MCDQPRLVGLRWSVVPYLKGRRFDSWSGHMPGLRVQSRWDTQERQRTDVPLSHQRCCLPSPSLMRIRKPLKKKTRNHSAERSQGNKGCVWGGFFLRGKAKDHNSALQENKRTGLQPKDSGPSPPGSRRDTGPEREWAWLPPPSPLEPSA